LAVAGLPGDPSLWAAGPLTPNDPIVLVAAWAVHRDAALDACRYIIDALKTRAPFWKHEQTADGARWVTPSE